MDKYIKGERVFLHDISNKIGIVLNGLELLLLKMENFDNIDEKLQETTDKLYSTVKKLVGMVVERRNEIKSKQSQG